MIFFMRLRKISSPHREYMRNPASIIENAKVVKEPLRIRSPISDIFNKLVWLRIIDDT